MKLATLSCSVVALVSSLVPAGASGQNVRTFVEFAPVGQWDPTDAIEIDASDESLDTTGAFLPLVGDVTGNTIDRASFKAAVAAAFTQGTGGVLDFEPANTTLSDVDYISPTTMAPVGRANEAATIKVGDMVIERGPNHYFEGTYSGSPFGPYRGRDTAAFDGTGPSGPDRANFRDVFFFKSNPSAAPNAIGNYLGLATSYDLDFDPDDKVVIVGFAMTNYDNFQSFSEGLLGGYPNMTGVATWTNGVDTITHMAVGISEQVANGNDHYFGFEAPTGYFLDRLQAYQIGNNSRAFIGLDDLGFVRVPEPTTTGLLCVAALAVGGFRRPK